jgi:hypothetical protein
MRTIGTVIPAVALLFTVSSARADVLWSADWSVPKPVVLSPGGQNALLLSTGPHFDGNGSASNIVASQITLQTPFSGASDSWTEQNYSVNLLLTDKASNASTTLVFSGAFSGTATPTGSSVTNEFVDGKTSYTVTLGSHQYIATLGPFVANGNGTNVGVLDAQVTVDGGSSPPPPPTHETPEPSTLVLMGLGLGAAVAARLRRSRTALTSASA